MGQKVSKREKETTVTDLDQTQLALAERKKLQADQIFISSLIIKETTLTVADSKPSSAVRFVVISDTHNKAKVARTVPIPYPQEIDSIPQGDVLIHCGDFTDNGYPGIVRLFTF